MKEAIAGFNKYINGNANKWFVIKAAANSVFVALFCSALVCIVIFVKSCKDEAYYDDWGKLCICLIVSYCLEIIGIFASFVTDCIKRFSKNSGHTTIGKELLIIGPMSVFPFAIFIYDQVLYYTLSTKMVMLLEFPVLLLIIFFYVMILGTILIALIMIKLTYGNQAIPQTPQQNKK